MLVKAENDEKSHKLSAKMTTVDEIPPALEQLDPQKLLAFKKGGKAQVAFTKATNDLISELFSCFSALGKTSILLVLEDGISLNHIADFLF